MAVSRYDNRKPRLRFAAGDTGWELLPNNEPIRPSLTPDRIAAMVALLTDVGLLEGLGEGAVRRTKRGAAMLERWRAAQPGR